MNKELLFGMSAAATSETIPGGNVDASSSATQMLPLNPSLLFGDDETAKLKLAVQQGAARNPDTATRLLQLQTKTGLPKDYLERNLDDVESEVRQQSFDLETFRKTSPSFAGWLSQHPDHPAAARQDLTKLNYLERQLRYIGANKEIGELQDELMGIGEQAMNDTAGPPVRARQQAIEKRLQELEALNAGTDVTGLLEMPLGMVVQQWPLLKRVIGGTAEGATKGLVIGAAGGAAMGGPAGAVAGGLAMMGPAALVGGGLEAGKAEMHAALLDYEKLKDENGQPLDRTTIKGLALMAGAANGTIEMLFGLESVMLKVPGVRSLTRQGLTELLKTPTSRDALLRFGRSLGTVMVEESVTEAMQMYVTKLVGAIGQSMQDGGPILDRVFTGENFRQAMQEAKAGAAGGGGMALPMVSATAVADLRRVKEAQRTQQAFESIGAVAASTKLREALPGTLRSIIESALKEGPIETLYLPIETFSTYFQSKGADPRDVAAALTGSPEDFDQAVASGGDLAVKTADYAEKIAGTEHNAFFARELRPSLAAMNAREADAWIDEQVNQDILPGVQTNAADDPAARVRQEIAGQLEALGFDPAVVDNYAQLYQSRYQARAERRGLGEDAFDLFRKVGLTIHRVLPEILKKVGGTTTEMDALLDRLRVGDVPKPGEIFGQSLVEALREIGLQEVGEVTALDPDQGRQPFQKKLVREDGLSLDQAAERMHEAGYLQERSIEQLLEAMQQELSGTPVYVPGAENALLLDVSRKLQDLQHYLTEQGVDLTATPNEQIKAMFERLLSAEEVQAVGQDPAAGEGTTFEQAALPAPIAPTFVSKVEQVVAEKMGGRAKVQALPITEPMKESVLKAGQPLFQAGGGKDAKGQITFGSGRIDIALLEKADLSTFIHETGHLYLNELIEDALTPGVPQQLRDDLDSSLGWMGLAVRVTDGADAIKAAIGRDQHELFARGFEAYALEGKSPSLAMREVFARFRQWLIQVYRLISYRGESADPARVGSALQVTLTPEVRKVMNRMVATEEEILAMESEAAVDPMFTDAESAGMTPAEFARYQGNVTQAGYLAREALQAQVLAQLARERTDWWKAKAEEVREEVLAEANQRPVYVALSVLQEGTMPDGSPLPEGMVAGKLSKKAVAAVFGRAFVGKLPRGTTTASGGMTPDHAAWLFGYTSGEQLLTDLANVRNKQELVEAETQLRMSREYGDPLIDGTLHEKARTAVLNAEREQVIEAEMVAIDKKRREITQGALAGLMPPPESVRKLAQAQIARQRIREIHPQAHFLAAQRANKAASEALWKRDYLAAGLAKQKEFLNLALYREATAAREEVERVVQHLRELRTKSKQEKIGKAGSDYLEQINAIMERYEFSPVPHITLAKRQALREWIAEKEHEGETLGEEFVVPEEILFEARKMNYKELPFEELEGIRDTIAQIEHFARAKNRLLAEQAIQDKEEARTLLINQLLANTPGRPPQALTESSMSRGEKMSRLAERYHASLLKTEQLMDELDGGQEGPWHDYFWNPAVDAQAAEADYTERITGKIAEAVVNIPASIRSRMLELVTIPGLPRPMSRKEIIGAALNVGNPSNKAKLLKGMAWSDRNLAEILEHLTKEEWDFVQKVWDTLESMWPDIVVLQKKLTGVAPEKVKIEPVQTKFGTYAGGYYPVMYAAALSAQGALQLSSTFGKLLDDNYVKATLPSGYRKGRIDEFAAPFDLDVDRLPSHIAGVVKDLTHRAWLIDANWIVSDRRIRAALKERLGDALTLRLADWVGQVANDRAGGSSKSLAVWMQLIESFRMNTVIVAMGFKFSTMASQIAGVAPAIEALGGKDGGGLKWFSVGVSEALRRPQSTYDFMTAKSGEMRHRITSRDRDLRDKLRALQGRKDMVAQLQEVSLRGIGYMELMVSMPTWIGGYRSALDAGKTDEQAVRAGDRAVRLSQGAAGAKDLAAVAGRSDTMMRLLTMFYTPFSALYNRLRSIGHDVEGIGDLPRAAVRLWLTVTVAATLGELLAGHGPDKDEPWWRWWIRVQAMYPFLAVPLLRDAISTLASGYGYQFSPIAQALETGTRLTRSVVKAAAGEKEWEELAGQAVKVFSYFVGLPTSQLVITAKYLHDLNAGSEHPDDLFEFTKKLLYARPKEN